MTTARQLIATLNNPNCKWVAYDGVLAYITPQRGVADQGGKQIMVHISSGLTFVISSHHKGVWRWLPWERQKVVVAARLRYARERPCCASSHDPPDTACKAFERGSNGRCVYCDHEEKCHSGPGATCWIGGGERGFKEPGKMRKFMKIAVQLLLMSAIGALVIYATVTVLRAYTTKQY